MNAGRLNRLLVDPWPESFAGEPPVVVLDLDVTDVPLQGKRKTRFFHGCYRV